MVSMIALVAMDPWGWDRFGPLHWAALSVAAFAVTARTLLQAQRTRFDWRLLVGWGVLLLGLTLSTALSDDRWHSVVGTPDRHLGLVTWLLFFGLFVAAVGWFATPDEGAQESSRVTMLLVGTSLGLLAVGGYGLLEVFDVGGFASNFAGDRLGGTFGQPAYLGAAAVLALPLALGLAASPDGARWNRYLGAGASISGVFLLAASQSRGAWVGAVVTLVAALIANRERLGSFDQSIRIRVAAALAVLASLVVAIPTLRQRAWSLTDFDGVLAGRSDEWQVGLRTLSSGGRAGGLIGLGPETYRVRFGEFVGTDYVIDYGREVFTDRAHSSLIDTALAAGWLGLAGYVLVLAVVLRSCRSLLGNGNAVDIAVGASVMGYLTQQLFLFPLAELDSLFWIIGGLAVARGGLLASGSSRVSIAVPQIAFDAGAIASGAVAIVALVAGVLDVAADHQVANALAEPDSAKALEHADAARALRPDSTRYDFIASRVVRRDTSAATLGAALERLDDGLTISPNDPALLAEQAGVQLDLARLAGDALRPDDPLLVAALRSLRHLDEVDRNNPLMQEKYGIALALAGETNEALRRLERVVELLPNNPAPLLNLAEVQERAGQGNFACDSLQAAERLSPDDATVLARLAEQNC